MFERKYEVVYKGIPTWVLLTQPYEVFDSWRGYSLIEYSYTTKPFGIFREVQRKVFFDNNYKVVNRVKEIMEANYGSD